MIKDRISQLLETKKIKKEKFFVKIGCTSANFRGNARNTPLNSDAIANIFTEIPDVNLKWLLTGEGDMLSSSLDTHEIKVVEKEVIVYKSDPKDATIIEMQDHTIKDKVKIIELQEDKISALEKSQRGDVESVKGVAKKEAQG